MRQRKSLTQEQVSDLSGIPLSTYKKVESGNHGVKPETLLALSRLFDCGVWEMAFDAPAMEEADRLLLDRLNALSPQKKSQIMAIFNRVIDLMANREIVEDHLTEED